MSVLNGFKKYKNYKADVNGDHQLQSFWTSTDTVEDADGNTLTEMIGELKKEIDDLGLKPVNGMLCAVIEIPD